MAPESANQTLQLSLSVVSRVDAARLARELESYGELLEQQQHQPQQATIRPSRMLEELCTINRLDLTKAADRTRLGQFLKEVKAKAPIIHMSFAAEPPMAFTAKLVTWLRREIHPVLLLDIGLQPSIAAGCIIRTNNKYFDCSVRQHLTQSKPQLVALIQGAQHA